MNSTPKLAVLAMGLLTLFAACEDDPAIPQRPEQPEQIAIARSYVRSSTGLNSNDVTSFLTLSNGEFWIGTNAGLTRYASVSAGERLPGDDGLVTEVNGLPHPQVRDMVEYSGTVYVATWGGGLGVYDVAGGTWDQMRPGSDGLTDGFIADLASSPTEDLLYCASNDGVFVLDPPLGTFARIETVDQDLLDRQAGNGLPLTDDEKMTLSLQRLVSAVAVREDAGVIERWYGPRVEVRVSDAQDARLGILVSKTATEYKYTRPNSGLVEPNVNEIYFDSVDNTYWLSYVSKGVSQVNVSTSTWTTYDLVDGLPSNTVNGITRAKNNTSSASVMWAATQNGLAKKGNGQWQSYGVSGGLPSNRVQAVYSDDGQRLWVGFVDAGAVRIK